MRRLILNLLVGFLFAYSASGEKIRIAVGPYFAPAGNDLLQKANELVPELLTVELSRGNAFEVLEREKVRMILQELHLTADNVNTSATILKLGQLLGCDRLVIGTTFSIGTNTQIWTKLIDTRTSVVLDLEAVPYEDGDLTVSVKNIARFLSRAGRSTSARQFIALGKIADLSVSSGREDWSPRFRTAIEKHFLDAGYGVVEREVMNPIIEEHQLEGAGLTGSYTNRIRLQPAVWMLDGGWRWMRNNEDRINVVLRLQKAGEPEQAVRVTALPDSSLKQQVLAGIEAILKKDGLKSPTLSVAAGEAALQHTRAMEMAMRNGPTTPSRFSTDPDSDEKAKFKENLRSMLEGFEKTLMLDPDNLNAKRMLARGLLTDEDPMRRQRATNLLQEIATTAPPALAAWAKETLGIAVAAQGLGTNRYDSGSNLNSRNSVPQAQRENVASNFQGPDTSNESGLGSTKNVIPTNSSGAEPIKFPARWLAVMPFEGVTAMGVEKGGWLIATGTKLRRIFPETDENSETNEIIEFTPALTNEITAVVGDDSAWWLGTFGGGLVRVDKSTRTTRVYGEREGLLMSSITTLAKIDDQLWIGFGFRESGGLGCLDLKTDRIRGFSGEFNLFKSGQTQGAGPPNSLVNAIKTDDKKTLWIGSSSAVHSFDVGTQSWKLSPSGPPMTARFGPYQRNENGMLSLQLPRYGCVTVNSKFVAVGLPLGGISLCEISASKWTRMNLSADRTANSVHAIRFDCCNDRLLWVGGRGKLSLVDMSAGKVIGVCDLVGLNEVMWIQSMEKLS